MGNETDRLPALVAGNNRTAYVHNAMDGYDDKVRVQEGINRDIAELEAEGLNVEIVDLKDYFGNANALRQRLEPFGVIWVRGGNTFVLRRAMQLSGLDELLKEWYATQWNVLYGGYSAGVCVLCPSLHGIHLADEADSQPYGAQYATMWDGLDILPYHIAPHYRSDHFESPLIEKCVAYYIEHKMLFIALHDGEVRIIV